METMNATLSNEDVILIMSTGGGKSLCYQLPAILSNGEVFDIHYLDGSFHVTCTSYCKSNILLLAWKSVQIFA